MLWFAREKVVKGFGEGLTILGFAGNNFIDKYKAESGNKRDNDNY